MMPTVSGKARPWVAGALAGVSVGLIGLVLAILRPAAVERGELWSYDLRLRSAAAERRATTDIVLINVSELDIENVENNLSLSWPWPRALFGYLATYCKRAGARVIVFDWLFQDRGEYAVPDAEEFATALREAGNTVIGLSLTKDPVLRESLRGPWATRIAQLPSRDLAIARALPLQAWNVRTFLLGEGPVELWIGGMQTEADLRALWTRVARPDTALALIDPEASDDAPPPALPAPRTLSTAELARELRIAELITEREGRPGPGEVPRRDGLDPPLGVLAAASRLGHVHQTPDLDGVMRRHAPLVRHAGRLFPSLPLAAYLVAHPEEHFELVDQTLVLGQHRIPLDASGRFPIRFVSAGGYRSLSAYEILRSQALLDEGKPPTVPDRALRGAYVIVAATAHGLRDLRATPIAEEQLGAEINANVLDNLERGAEIHRVSGALDGALTLLLCLGTALAMTALGRAVRRPILALPLMLFVAAALVGGHVALARWLLSAHDLWIAVTVPGGACAISSFVTMVGLSVSERQSRRFVQEALGRYTSPELVRELIAHPEHLSLDWGQEREMSVYFSDIAGFTTISEHLSARQLVALLNEYLTEMTDLVLAHGGVVDKYIGDAVMAFWGAPLPAPDHAVRAVTCAIAMRQRCDQLRTSWQERYGHAIHARAGINSGDAVVGNMGSKHKYNYTVMGDIVNLASRLEGANKPYGTYLMISEATLAKLDGAVAVRELDLVAVKGKEQPVKVYEVLDLVAHASAEALALARRFEAGLERYRARQFSQAQEIFAELVKSHDDPPSKLYLERCDVFATEPPPADWNGVWHLKEK